MSGKVTQAVTAVRRAGAPFAVHDVDIDVDRGIGAAMAAALGVDAARVHKTLVVRADGELAVAVVPVDGDADLKAIAAALGAKRVTMAEPTDAERATGYVVGGISPLGQRRHLSTVVDADALDHQTVFVSAGRRGLELELTPSDLVRLTGATVARISTGGPA